MPVNARKAAYLALTATRKRGARPEMALSTGPDSDPRERALAQNIVTGVLQNAFLLDYALLRYTGRDPGGLQPEVRDILRLSVYQLLFLDRVPAHAAVNEGVELAREFTPRAAGLVNALLRRVSVHAGVLPEVEAPTREEALSLRWSHPVWLVRELTVLYGPDKTERMLAADNEPPPLTAQVNTLKTSAGELRKALERRGIGVSACPYFSDALYLTGTGALEEVEEFQRGLFYIQDAAARFAVLASGVKPGETVLDLCAAPGGKSFAAAIQMEDRGDLRAFDIHEKKAGLVTRGAARLGIHILKAAAGDASRFDPALEDVADAVLCDVPCSGFGVIRKKPEIRYKDPAELERLPEIQLGILKNACRYVKPGGRLVYSTCTVLKRENEDVIRAFLGEYGGFEPVSFSLPAPFTGQKEGTVILPGQGGTDGFFICVLRKK